MNVSQPQLFCPTHNKITRTCTNSSCLQPALFCNVDSCGNCSDLHQFCPSLKLSAFHCLLRLKLGQYKDFFAKIGQIEEKMMSDMKKFHIEVESEFFVLQGNDRELINKLYSQNGKGVNGRDINEFHKRLQEVGSGTPEECKHLVDLFQQETQEMLEGFINYKKKMVEELKRAIKKRRQTSGDKMIKQQRVQKVEQLKKSEEIQKEEKIERGYSYTQVPSRETLPKSAEPPVTRKQFYLKLEDRIIEPDEMLESAIQSSNNDIEQMNQPQLSFEKQNELNLPKHQPIKKQRKRPEGCKHNSTVRRSNILIRNLVIYRDYNRQFSGGALLKRSEKIIRPSKILPNISRQQMDFIKECLYNPVELHLLYIASQEQYSAAKFHEKCDNIPHTFILVKTKEGKTFGGYTPNPWVNYTKQSVDYNLKTCLFSVSYKTKLHLKDPRYATYSNPSYGPCFSSSLDLAISDQCNINNNSAYFLTYFEVPHTLITRAEACTYFTGSKQPPNFLVSQYEVFKVVY